MDRPAGTHIDLKSFREGSQNCVAVITVDSDVTKECGLRCDLGSRKVSEFRDECRHFFFDGGSSHGSRYLPANVQGEPRRPGAVGPDAWSGFFSSTINVI